MAFLALKDDEVEYVRTLVKRKRVVMIRHRNAGRFVMTDNI